MGVGLVHSWPPPLGCRNVVSPSNQVVVMISSASHKQVSRIHGMGRERKAGTGTTDGK